MNPVQAPAMEGEPLPDPEPDGDDVPLAKRRKAMPAEKSSPGAEVSLPTQSRVLPRRPARKGKVAEPVATNPEAGPSGSNRRDATSQKRDVPTKTKVIAVDGKQVVTKKGEAIADDANAGANAKESSLPQAVVGNRTGLEKEAVEKVKRVLRSSKEVAPASPVDESVYSSDDSSLQEGSGGDVEDKKAAKKAPKKRKYHGMSTR